MKKIFIISAVVLAVLFAVLFLLISRQTDLSVVDSNVPEVSQDADNPSAGTDAIPNAPAAVVSLFQDSDGDGLYDKDELRLGRNPQKKDVDFEFGSDTDKDGLPDAVEQWFGTDLRKIDSDGDGASDSAMFELVKIGIIYGDDRDGDGLTDYAETTWYGTDIQNPDTDGDGFADGVEVLNGYNPNGEGQL